MKRAYLGVLFAVLLAGAAAYGQSQIRADANQGDSFRFRGSVPTTIRTPSTVFYHPDPFLPNSGGSGAVVPSGKIVRRDDRNFRAHRRNAVVIVAVAPCYSDYDYVSEDLQGYYQPGYEWGTSLRQYSVSWDQFGPYLEEYVVNASPAAQDAFRRGFIEAFGGNAEALYDRAMRRAAQRG
jgi:hypothetical protein